ncbi:hypothetical protein FJZ31_18615 [Candidatus Poribacteria bacterium]|nr:hypothetical protein [Candidatus Poribacteria bacterium]
MSKNKAFVGIRTIPSVKELHELLKKLFKKIFQKNEVYYLLQQSNKIDEIRHGLPNLDQLQKFAEGRAFDVNIELRWKRVEEWWNLLVLSDAKAVKNFSPLEVDVEWDVQNGKDCYLAGRWNQKLGKWIAPHLKRELEYPTFGKPDMDKIKPMVETVNYREKNTKTIRFVRLKRVNIKRK